MKLINQSECVVVPTQQGRTYGVGFFFHYMLTNVKPSLRLICRCFLNRDRRERGGGRMGEGRRHTHRILLAKLIDVNRGCTSFMCGIRDLKGIVFACKRLVARPLQPSRLISVCSISFRGPSNCSSSIRIRL